MASSSPCWSVSGAPARLNQRATLAGVPCVMSYVATSTGEMTRTWSAARWLRTVAFAVLAAHILIGPFLAQIADIRSPLWRPWTMFSQVGVGVLDGAFTVEDGEGAVTELSPLQLLEFDWYPRILDPSLRPARDRRRRSASRGRRVLRFRRRPAVLLRPRRHPAGLAFHRGKGHLRLAARRIGQRGHGP